MSLNKYLLLGTLLFLNSQANADGQCASAVGNTIIGKTTIQCMKIVGTASLTNTTMVGLLTLSGDLNATHATLNDLSIVGNVNLQNTTVAGNADITGKLNASDSKLSGIKLHGEEIILSNSTSQDILIDSSRDSDTSHLVLNNNSIVNGDITFSDGKGIVENHNSKITGKIIGGKLQ
jgi:hypothetical protein